MEIDFSKISNVDIDGIDHKDAPDYCDAFIGSCDYMDRIATDEELDLINENSEFIHEQVYNHLY